MNTANVAWMITATIFVLMMTPGLSFFYGGMVGKKNVISTILQSFIAMGVVSVIWVVPSSWDAAAESVMPRPTSPLSFWGLPCCGWDGSDSMQGLPWLPTVLPSRLF